MLTIQIDQDSKPSDKEAIDYGRSYINVEATACWIKVKQLYHYEGGRTMSKNPMLGEAGESLIL